MAVIVPKDPTPSPTPSNPTSPGSRWGDAGNDTGNNVKSGSNENAQTGYGNVVLTGFGPLNTRTVGQPGTSFSYKESYYSDALYNSAADLKALFVQLDYNNDPRLVAWMNSLGIKDKKVAAKIWDKAADYAFKLAKGGKKVNFFDITTSKTFSDSIASGQKSQSTKYINLTDKLDADNMLEKAMGDMLNRKPTKAEYADFLKQLNKNENKYFKTVYYQDGVQKTTGVSFDAQSFVNQYVLGKVNFTKDLEGNAGFVQDTVNQVIRDNGLTGYVSDAVARKWMAGLASGSVTKEQLTSDIRSQAIKAYKPFAKMMEENPTMSLSDVASSYLTAYSKVLEVDPAQMDIKDALSKAVTKDQTGETVMSLFDYEKTLKKDPKYQYTKSAANAAQNLAQSFARAFGVNV